MCAVFCKDKYMKLMAKILVCLACAVIMLHAVVPHHHHEGCEVAECCFLHHHHDDHEEHEGNGPFDFCKLQDMLSHLVLSTKDDDSLIAAMIKAEAECYCLMPALYLGVVADMALLPTGSVAWGEVPVRRCAAPECGASALRAPPMA